MLQTEGQKIVKSPESKPFEFQNWPVYREAVEFGVSAHKLCGKFPKEGAKSVSDQLRRASHQGLSTILRVGQRTKEQELIKD